MTILPEGYILFEVGEIMPKMRTYRKDASNPLLMIPNFKDGGCQHRAFTGHIKPCGRINLSWGCKKFNREVNISFCEDCPEPRKDNGTVTIEPGQDNTTN